MSQMVGPWTSTIGHEISFSQAFGSILGAPSTREIIQKEWGNHISAGTPLNAKLFNTQTEAILIRPQFPWWHAGNTWPAVATQGLSAGLQGYSKLYTNTKVGDWPNWLTQ